MLLELDIYTFKNKGKRGLFKVDEPFFGNVVSRFNFMVGVGIPKPLDNIYAGLGYDLGPGIKVNTCVHLFKYKKYQIQNNAITKESSTYAHAVPFVSVAINPSLIFAGVISLFKKS